MKDKSIILRYVGRAPTSLIEAVNNSTLTFVNSARQFCKLKCNVYLIRTLHMSSYDDSMKVYKFDKGNGV